MAEPAPESKGASASVSVLTRARRLLALDGSDRRPLAALAPIFAVSAASAIIGSSAAKSLFLSANDLGLLPWMFLASATFTAVVSSLYVAAIQRAPLEVRYPVLLAFTLVSFVALRLFYPVAPEIMSLAVFVWLPGMGYLIALQAWSTASSLLPTRQGKRLFPVLAAVATAGAAGGGALVKLLLNWWEAEDLIWLTAALLVVPLVTVRGTIRRLRRIAEEGRGDPAKDAKGPRATDLRPVVAESAGVLGGFRAIARSPLLWRLALFVFCLQAMSVLVDFQFNGELKRSFSKREIASFLGTFYLVSNAVVVLLSLFASGRILKSLGVGLSLSLGALLVGAGSAVYLVAAGGEVASPFAAMAFTAFALHVGQYAMTRNAIQVLVTPLDTIEGERSRTLIDGVVYRLATIVASVALLLVAPAAQSLYVLSPVVIVASLVVVVFGLKVGPHYRAALFQALRARRLDDTASRILDRGLGRRALREVERRLQDPDPAAVRYALDVINDLHVDVRPELLEALVRFGPSDIAERALQTLRVTGNPPSRELLHALLTSERPLGVVREALHACNQGGDASLLEVVRPLVRHADPTVAALAGLFRLRFEDAGGVEAIEREFEEGEDHDPRHRASEVGRIETARQRAVGLARDLFAMVGGGAAGVTPEAVQAMGRMRLPAFVDPLVACLAERRLRASAIDALVSQGAIALPRLAERLAEADLPLSTRVALYQVFTRVGSREAVSMLEEQTGSPSMAVRSEAVLALWRAVRRPQTARPSESSVRARILEEIERLRRYAGLERSVSPTNPFRMFFRDELETARFQAERRVLRLLGILCDRAALYRVYLHYRSKTPRVRSNAIELLEQHVLDPALKPFVGLVERVGDASGEDQMRTVMVRKLVPDGTVVEMLSGVEPWLRRLWSWVLGREEKPALAFEWGNTIDRVFQLRHLPIFEGLSGEQLASIAPACDRREWPAGSTLFEQDDEPDYLYLIQNGSIDVERKGRHVARLGGGEAVGELAALYDARRSATARVAVPSRVVSVPVGAFHDLLDRHAALGRTMIGILVRRSLKRIDRRE
jgi:AAA family ATP:ADP antiporter